MEALSHHIQSDSSTDLDRGPTRSIVHMDLDSFFVSCTLLKMPQMKGKPLVIGGSSNRGVVSSASYEARHYGVRSGMPTRYARMLCPDLTVLKGDFDLFSDYSNTVNEIIAEKAPLFERASIDEFYMDMTGMDRYHSSILFTRELVKRISNETGLPLSFGLSVNKTVAKMCTNYAKPNGQLEIQASQVQPFLDPQSIRSIPYLGENSFRLLRRMSIKRILQLRQVPVESLEDLFGKNGISIWKKANGIDNSPLIPYSERKSVSTECTFDRDTQDLKQLKAVLISMVEKLGFQLRKSQLLCSTVGVRIRYSNRDTESAQCKVSFTSNDDRLIAKVLELFDRLYHRRILLRLVGVKLSNFVRGSHQIDLFTDNTKLINLYDAMDRLKHRYNDASLVRRAIGMGSNTKDLS